MLTITSAPRNVPQNYSDTCAHTCYLEYLWSDTDFGDDQDKTDPSALLSGMHTRLAMMRNKGDSSKH